MLAQHREIHVVLDRNIRSEAVVQKAEDIEVLQPCDVWSQGNTACARIDRSRNSHHDMTRPRDFDPDGLRQLVGAGGDLFRRTKPTIEPWLVGAASAVAKKRQTDHRTGPKKLVVEVVSRGPSVPNNHALAS